MNKNLICALLCIFSLAATAQAVNYTLTWDITTNAATAADGTSLDKIVGTLDAGPGGKVTSFDLGTGITGMLYQDWLFGGAIASTYSKVLGNNSPTVDTQLLFDSGDVIEGATVVEDNDKSMSASAGWGTCMTGAVGITGPIQTQSVDFIQVYVAAGTMVDFCILTPGGDFCGPWYHEYPLLRSTVTPDVAYARVDTPATITLTVENLGVYSTQLSGTFPSASGEFGPGSTSTFGPIGSLESDSRQYTYTPTARGADTQTITVTNVYGGNSDVTLSGVGVGPVFDSSMAPGSTLDFDEVLPSTPESLYLDIGNITPDENDGDDALTDLTLLDVVIGGADSDLFDIVGFAPDTLVHKDGVLSLEISYNGAGTPGMKNATLDIFTDEDAALGAIGSIFSYNIAANVVPDPSILVLLIAGSIGPLFVRRR